jgi:hypothetical protein
MKRYSLIITTFITSCFIASCTTKNYDDDIESLSQRVSALEEWQKTINSNISSLQTITSALQDRDYVTSVTKLSDGNGYLINFVKSGTVTIKNGEKGDNGKDGINGTNGTNGKDGTNGTSPIIGVKLYSDGNYYWTIDNRDGNGVQWLKDGSGNMIRTTGDKGATGESGISGKDAIAPQVRINTSTNYWEVSTDGGTTWKSTGVKATGENGNDGTDYFKNILVKNGYVYFTLNNTESTIIQVPYYTPTSLTINIGTAGTLSKLLTDEQMRTIISLKLTGNINRADMKTINRMLIIENLDIEGCTITDGTLQINPYSQDIYNKTIRSIILPPSISSTSIEYCLSLKNVTITGNDFSLNNSSYTYCESLDTLTYKEGITSTADASGYYPTIILPSTVKTVIQNIFSENGPWTPATQTVICKALNPPALKNNGIDFYDYYKPLSNMVLQVPLSSVNLYKNAVGWKNFGTIEAIQ